MGLGYSIKKSFMKRHIQKNKQNSVFDVEESDCYVLPEGAESKQNNSHYFTAQSFNTKECLLFRSALRGGDDTDELWLVLRDKDGKIYMAEKDHVEKGGHYPCKVECITPGKVMRISYDGNVLPAALTEEGYKPDKKAALIKLKLTADFTATGSAFEFTKDLASETLARAIAKEKLNKSFKDTMAAIHQVHYEQAGKMNVNIDLGGKKTEFKDFLAVRDHSYGRRDWNYFDAYLWNIIILENGDFLHTSLLRYPALSHLHAGFFKQGNKTKSLLEATPLDKLGGGITGKMHEKFEYTAEYIDGEKKKIEVSLDFYMPFKFDDDLKILEGVCDFKVDGVRGRGIAELLFNADPSRWHR